MPNWILSTVSVQTTQDTPLGDHISAKIQLVREAAPMIFNPMFIIIGKNDRGEGGEAENQAYRSGPLSSTQHASFAKLFRARMPKGQMPVPLSSLRPSAPMY